MNSLKYNYRGCKLPASFLLVLALLMLMALPSQSAWAGESMKIRLVFAGESLPAVLEDSPSGRDFWNMLPFTVSLKDYNRTEKIGDPPRRLNTNGAPEGFSPVKGDLNYYAPWGNLAIFYRDYSWSRGLVRLGHISSGIEKLAALQDGVEVTFERAD